MVSPLRPVIDVLMVLPLRPVIDVLMVSPPEQFIHSLGTSHSAEVLLQSKASRKRKRIVVIQFENSD